MNPVHTGDPTTSFDSSWEWNIDYQLKKYTDPRGNVTEYTYESDNNPQAPVETRGNLLEIIRTPVAGLPITVSYTYDAQSCGCPGSKPTTAIDGRGKTYAFEYTESGNRTKITFPIESRATPGQNVALEFQYNDEGQITRRILPANGIGGSQYAREDQFNYYPETHASYGYLQSIVIDEGPLPENLELTTTFE